MIGWQVNLSWRRFAAALVMRIKWLEPSFGVHLTFSFEEELSFRFTLMLWGHLIIGCSYRYLEKAPPEGEEKCPNCDGKRLEKIMNRRPEGGYWVHYKTHGCRDCGEVHSTHSDLVWGAEELARVEKQIKWDRRRAKVKGWFGRK